MGPTKATKPANKKHKALNMRTKSGSSNNPLRSKVGVRQNGSNLRDKATINRVNMYKAKAIRNKEGKVIGGSFMMPGRAGDVPLTAASGRVAPDRRWFGNTRVIGQKELDKFRQEMTTRAADPYSVVLRRKKLPMGLLQEPAKTNKMKILETESYQDVFTGKRNRKRPKLAEGTNDLSSLLAKAQSGQEAYGAESHVDSNIVVERDYRDEKRAELFEKGQSRRIWGELYKVLDCSDVVIQVLDARNVPGTRCPHLEKHLKTNASHKHLVFVLNKVDLVPSWVAKKWVKILSQEYPTLAFHASINNSFGKGALINLLRQFSKLHSDKKQISVGIIGYPNVGKSSIINTLKKKRVAQASPVPGQTKVWQYIALMRRIFIVDCPGVVYDIGDDETEIVLKGVVRAERLPDPTEFIQPILDRVKPEYIRRCYGLSHWEDALDFMTQLAKKQGRLLPGAEPDLHSIAVNCINDWQRGKLPFFVPPPLAEGETVESVEAEPHAVPQVAGAQLTESEQAEAAAAVGSSGEADADSGDEVDDDDEVEVEEDGAGSQEEDTSGSEEGSEAEDSSDDDDKISIAEGETAPASSEGSNDESAEPSAVELTVHTDLAWGDL